MADTAKEKFDAAVKVIRGLPKNGTFQPSHELMLKFYGFYKQSTEGPCKQSKPSFWDVVNKAKWDAWNKLGEMPREEAMLKYVDELKTIIETMPQTKQVEEFMDTIGSFYEMIEENVPGEKKSKPLKLQNGGNGDHDDSDDEEIEIESNISFNNGIDNSFNHSAAVEDILRNAELMNAKQPHITVRENNMVHQQFYVEKPKNENREKEEIKINGGMKDDVESGSDTDEFCDTSDEPIQDPLENGHVIPMLNTSTPITKTENRVQFTDKDSIQTEAQIHQTTPSYRFTNSQNLRMGLLSNSVPYSSKFNRDTLLSDSLLVNAASNDSLNLSIDSQLGVSLHHPDNSVLQQTFDKLESDSVMTRGGGNLPTGQGSFPVSTDLTDRSVSARGNAGNISGSRRGLFPPGSGGAGEDEDDVSRIHHYGDLNQQIVLTLVRLQQDMNSVLSRLTNLEAMTERQSLEKERQELHKKSTWWPFGNISKRTAAFIFIWPFLAHFIIALVCNRRRRR
ncbi:acyl-CoA-binding domain-containing protein 5 isoform X2 [Patella vulgata]|uniref:acyl-CoA-binding domain-containing protein 5 isoform X2 n=1 Tax=Patella vulgata TaxID=6465 RepID=UPI0024A9505C|nr:acyl-CoA-binding domain-containing protein 5 isoform X2 [Patella vulgata]